MDRSPLPVYSARGEFLRAPRLPTSPASDSRIPPPPTAAPAAGGWGIRGSRLVHSVGVGRVAAGGATEVEVPAVVCLVSICSSSGDGVPWSSFARGSTSLSSSIYGSVEFVEPLPVLARRRCRCLVSEGDVAFDQVGLAARGAGWRCHAEERRLPARRGVPPSPRLWRFGGGFRRRSVLLHGDEARVQLGPCCNFFVCLDFSVRNLV